MKRVKIYCKPICNKQGEFIFNKHFFRKYNKDTKETEFITVMNKEFSDITETFEIGITEKTTVKYIEPKVFGEYTEKRCFINKYKIIDEEPIDNLPF